MSKSSLEFLAKKVSDRVESEILKLGIQYRIFYRSKDLNSIKEKIERKIKDDEPYSIDGKKLRDLIGVRIVTYFQDDIPLVLSMLDKAFIPVEREIDSPDTTVFKPKRTNIIYSLIDEDVNLLKEFITEDKNEEYKLADSTFELQLRTVLSEGWHEIDHNLRYKCKDDWSVHKEKERMLNGIYASLETNDIALKSLFNEIAYQHFKSNNWEALLRTKFRIKFKLSKLNKSFIDLLNSDTSIGKSIVKLDRHDALLELSKLNNNIPLTLNNFLCILNFTCLKEHKIDKLTSPALKELMDKFYK